MSEMKIACLAIAGGCVRSQMDMSRIASYLRANGWHVVDKPDAADLLVVCGCAFTNEAEALSCSYLRSLTKRVRPTTQVVVVGCIAGIVPESTFEAMGVKSLTRDRLDRLDGLIDAAVPFAEVPDANVLDGAVREGSECFGLFADVRAWTSYPADLPVNAILGVRDRLRKSLPGRRPKSETVYRIRVGTGCSSRCTYCVIRLATGELKSKPIDQVLREFESGRAAGFKRFELVGEDVGAYGQDIGVSVVDLLNALFAVPGDYSVEWGDFGPNWLVRYAEGLLPLIRTNADRIHFAAFPIQSGSERILRAMARPYTASEVVECASAIKRDAPSVLLGTHIMVGFPGESHEDFRQTVAAVRAVPFDVVQPYVYSPRAGTPAAAMPNRVGELAKQARAWSFRLEWRMSRPRSRVSR